MPERKLLREKVIIAALLLGLSPCNLALAFERNESAEELEKAVLERTIKEFGREQKLTDAEAREVVERAARDVVGVTIEIPDRENTQLFEGVKSEIIVAPAPVEMNALVPMERDSKCPVREQVERNEQTNQALEQPLPPQGPPPEGEGESD